MTPQTDNHLSAAIARGSAAAASPYVLGMVLLPVSPVQAAAAPRPLFRLPAGPAGIRAAALLHAGRRCDGGLPAPGCGGTSRAVSGEMTSEQALAALSPRGCAFDRRPVRFRVTG